MVESSGALRSCALAQLAFFAWIFLLLAVNLYFWERVFLGQDCQHCECVHREDMTHRNCINSMPYKEKQNNNNKKSLANLY